MNNLISLKNISLVEYDDSSSNSDSERDKSNKLQTPTLENNKLDEETIVIINEQTASEEKVIWNPDEHSLNTNTLFINNQSGEARHGFDNGNSFSIENPSFSLNDERNSDVGIEKFLIQTELEITSSDINFHEKIVHYNNQVDVKKNENISENSSLTIEKRYFQAINADVFDNSVERCELTNEALCIPAFDEESASSADYQSSHATSRSQTPCRNHISGGLLQDEESMSSTCSNKKKRLEPFDPDNLITADHIIEYQWPCGAGHFYLLQEQIALYLVESDFSTHYPLLRRRLIERAELDFLRNRGYVKESITTGTHTLTAVLTQEILVLISSDFPDKFESLNKILQERKLLYEKNKSQTNNTVDRGKLQRMAIQNASDWNQKMNRRRKHYYFDLQTFTIHEPIRPEKYRKIFPIGDHPVALLPGQYHDYYRKYTSTELKYLPLNTVIYGPIKNSEHSIPYLLSDGSLTPSENSSSDEDDNESSTSESSRELMDKNDSACKVCSGSKNQNKQSIHEELVTCGKCGTSGHPSCLQILDESIAHVKAYNWQCQDCKTCYLCKDPDDEDKMIFCDLCDRGKVPQGRWHCSMCAICNSCECRVPWGNEYDKNAHWQHEYTDQKYVRTFCQPCFRLYKRNLYCKICYQCNNNPSETSMQLCIKCERRFHLECDQNHSVSIDSNYTCSFCQEKKRKPGRPPLKK